MSDSQNPPLLTHGPTTSSPATPSASRPDDHTTFGSTPTVAELVNELKILRKGRGVQAPQIPDRIGPALRAVCAIIANDDAASVRQKVVAQLRDLSARLSPDQQICVTAAFGLDETQHTRLYMDRVRWAERELQRDARTVRRRIDNAIVRLAELAVIDLQEVNTTARAEPTPTVGGMGSTHRARGLAEEHDQLRETLDRVRAVLANLNQDDLHPDRQRVVNALDALSRRETTQPLTDDERTLLDFVAHIERSTLGTPAAQRLRRQTSSDTISTVLRSADQLSEPQQPVSTSGGPSIPRPTLAGQAMAEDLLAATQRLTTSSAVGILDTWHESTEIFTRLKSTTFHELVVSSIAGQQDAIATLFTWIRTPVLRYCRSRIGPSGTGAGKYSAADDVAQEICVAVLGALSRYSDAPESFLPLVFGIAAHKVTEHHHRIGQDPHTPADTPDIEDVSPEQQTMAAELRDRLAQLLDSLPPRDSEVLRLRLVIGLTAQETAAILGITPTAVRVTQHRALAKLRTALQPHEWI